MAALLVLYVDAADAELEMLLVDVDPEVLAAAAMLSIIPSKPLRAWLVACAALLLGAAEVELDGEDDEVEDDWVMARGI